MTVLLCDLVGSTRLAGELDPEEYRELMLAYQAAAGEEIERHEGHIAQYQGDGLLVYFGFPHAQGGEAARAVRAGVGIITAVRDLNRCLGHGDKLAVRIGIHTGAVVTGELGHGEATELALGRTPSIAAGIQALAPANGLAITDVSRRELEEEPFLFDSVGSHSIDRVGESVEVFILSSSHGA